ncbi:MAG: hypothetical protein AAF657_09940 [Acidobacteriota bacterium]
MRLQRGTSKQLLELIGEIGGRLSAADVRSILRNPFVTSEVIGELALNRDRLTIYEVRSAIARHRRTPTALALRFVPDLFWRDLLEITLDVRIRPVVRQVADRYLVERLKRLTLGEKIAIARRASGSVLTQLAQDPSLRVMQALLGNSRLTEVVLLQAVADVSTGPRKLDLVARDPRWGGRYEICLALSRNPRSPFRVLFDILPRLRRADLLAVAELEAHSSIVRHRAHELLED